MAFSSRKALQRYLTNVHVRGLRQPGFLAQSRTPQVSKVPPWRRFSVLNVWKPAGTLGGLGLEFRVQGLAFRVWVLGFRENLKAVNPNPHPYAVNPKP